MSSFLGKLKNRLPKGQFARSVAVLAGGTAFGQAITILASPILTRLYRPVDFGVLAVYTSILSIIVVVASLRYELAIPLPKDKESAANLLLLAMGIIIGMSLLTGLLVWAGGDRFLHWLKAEVLRPYLWLLPFSFAGAGAYEALSYWAIREKAFPLIARTKMSQSIGQVFIQLTMGFFHTGPGGLLLGDVAGRVSGSGTLAALVWRNDRESVKKVRLGTVLTLAMRYKKFPLLSSFSALLNVAGLQVPVLILTAFYGSQVVGWFALGQRVIGAPMVLVGQAVAQVYMGEASRLAQEKPGALYALLLKSATRLLAIGAIPVALLAFFGPWLFSLIFGATWHEAGVYMQILAVMFLMQFAVVPLSQTLNILERQDLQLAWDAARLLLVVGGLVLAGTLHWPGRTAILVYSAVMFFAYVGLLILSVIGIKRSRYKA